MTNHSEEIDVDNNNRRHNGRAGRRVATFVCAALLAVSVVGCGASAHTGTNDSPSVSTTPGNTTPAAVTEPPKSGGAGF